MQTCEQPGIHSKDFLLFIVQVDHLSGECIGQVIDVFYQAGASNVQVISCVTKKNRPSYLIIIDCKAQLEKTVQNTILQELHVGGWHKVRTTHCYVPNEILEYSLRIRAGKISDLFVIQAKHFEGGGIRPEHESVMALKRYLNKEYACCLDYNMLYAYASAAIVNNGEAELDLSAWKTRFREQDITERAG